MRVYTSFLVSAVENRAVYGAACEGDLVAVFGPLGGALPLWPTRRDADHFISRYWPDLRTQRMPLRQLMQRLPILAIQGVPVGIGLAPLPDAVVLPALNVLEDLNEGLEACGELAPGRRPVPGAW